MHIDHLLLFFMFFFSIIAIDLFESIPQFTDFNKYQVFIHYTKIEQLIKIRKRTDLFVLRIFYYCLLQLHISILFMLYSIVRLNYICFRCCNSTAHHGLLTSFYSVSLFHKKCNILQFSDFIFVFCN